MLCDAKPITIELLLHMHNHSSSYMFTVSAMLLCSWTMASSRYLCGVHAVLFAVRSIILLPSN